MKSWVAIGVNIWQCHDWQLVLTFGCWCKYSFGENRVSFFFYLLLYAQQLEISLTSQWITIKWKSCNVWIDRMKSQRQKLKKHSRELSSAWLSVVTAWIDNPRFLQSQILCRFYNKSSWDKAIHWGPQPPPPPPPLPILALSPYVCVWKKITSVS